MEKCLDDGCNREVAVVIVLEPRKVTSNFGRTVELDVTTAEKEYAAKLFPLNAVLDASAWRSGFVMGQGQEKMSESFLLWDQFENRILRSFTSYLIPQIELAASTTKDAVCVIFEKVNTGGKPLDTFELVTAMYAAEGHVPRKD